MNEQLLKAFDENLRAIIWITQSDNELEKSEGFKELNYLFNSLLLKRSQSAISESDLHVYLGKHFGSQLLLIRQSSETFDAKKIESALKDFGVYKDSKILLLGASKEAGAKFEDYHPTTFH